jgi:hypothetical protein
MSPGPRKVFLPLGVKLNLSKGLAIINSTNPIVLDMSLELTPGKTKVETKYGFI